MVCHRLEGEERAHQSRMPATFVNSGWEQAARRPLRSVSIFSMGMCLPSTTPVLSWAAAVTACGPGSGQSSVYATTCTWGFQG